MYKLRNSFSMLFASKSNGSETSNNGSVSKYHLNKPIDLGFDTNNYFRVLKSTIWYNNPNISIELNNNIFEFTYSTFLFTFNFEKGLYSLADINERLAELFQNYLLDSDFIILVSDQATSKISMQFKESNVAIDWTGNTMGSILGFTTNIISSVAGEWYESDTIAKLNNLSMYLIKSDFTSSTYDGAQAGSSIVGLSTPNVPVSSQIITEPLHPFPCLINGHLIDEITFSLTNELGQPVDCRDEEFVILGQFLSYDKN